MKRIVCALLLAVAAPPLAAAPLAAAPPPAISARTAGLERRDGFLPWYWDPGKGQLLLEVARLEEPFLYGVGIAGGAGVLEASLDRGQLGDLGVCRFTRVGRQVLLERLQTAHRADASDPERARVVEESFPTSVLASLAVVAESGSRVLVDATAFLLNDTQVLAILRQAQQGEWNQDPARSAFRFERSGAFPRNTEIEARLTFSSDRPPDALAAVLPDGHTLSLTIHHTFLKLPEPGFHTRALDPRIGYFTQMYRDHAAPYTEPIERYLTCRWRLEKKDPAAAVSEPVQPIVYYLDRGMPEPERHAVREAALWWNRAFMEAGFRNALVIEDLPPGATFLDTRYSGIEWVSRAERAWSIGQTQVDPRTSEIVHAVALIDSHRRRTTSRVWQNLRPPRGACDAGDSPDLSWLAPGDPGVPEDSLVLARLAYLSAHEVGHTLGLEHNWAATTFGWGSVMDYLGPHIELRNGALDLSDAYPRDVGAYDRLAIRWGYTPDADSAGLDQMVREGLARGIVYPLTSDPRWAEYDWGSDPVAWLGTTLAVRRAILERFGAAQLRPGEPLYDLQSRFNLAYLYHRFAVQAAQQVVGGRYAVSALAGDGQTPQAWVPAAKQREALARLIECLAPGNLDIPDRVLEQLVPPPSGMEATRERFASEAGESFSPLTAARVLATLVVSPLLDPAHAARLTLATGPADLTLDEMLERLVEATWNPRPDASPRLQSLRRVAQRVVLEGLMGLAARPEASPEVRAAALARLERLRRELHARRGDAATESHLRLAERDLAEFLDHPEGRRARPLPPAPPGRPIGQ